MPLDALGLRFDLTLSDPRYHRSDRPVPGVARVVASAEALLPAPRHLARARRRRTPPRPRGHLRRPRRSRARRRLGYTVTLESARLVIAGVTFTTAGESHGFVDAPRLLPTSHARTHPGHYAGGEVIDELAGPFVVEWRPAATTHPTLGVATLLAGDCQGADLALVAAATAHGLAPADPLVGAGAHLVGTAERAGRRVRFEATLTLPEPPRIAGLPLALVVTPETRVALGLALATRDPFEGDTLFDGLDFFALAGDEAAITLPADPAKRLRRAFFSHDHHLLTSP